MYVLVGAIASVVPGATLIHPLVAVVFVLITPLVATQFVRFVLTRVP